MVTRGNSREDPIPLRKLTRAEAKAKIAARQREFVVQFNQLTKTNLLSNRTISPDDLFPFQSGMFGLLDDCEVEVYIDSDNKINYVLTKHRQLIS